MFQLLKPTLKAPKNKCPSKQKPTAIMIASSFGTKTQGRPTGYLPRVNFQVQLFKIMFPHGTVIKTSKYQGKMMTYDELKQELVRALEKANSDVYLFYTGHSDEDGNWHIDLIDSHHDSINNDSVGWLCKLWKKHRSYKSNYLYILLDTCFGAKLCRKLREEWMKQQCLNVGIVAGSKGETDDENGIFETCLLAKQLMDHSALDNKLAAEQSFYYFPEIMTGSRRVTLEHVEVIRRAMTESENLVKAIQDFEKSRQISMLESIKRWITS